MKLYNEIEKKVYLNTNTEKLVNKDTISLRYLPFPFKNYCSIASDCDGPNIDKFNNLGRIFRYEYNLPIADSYFVNWFYKKGLAQETFDNSRFIKNNFDWMQNFYDGWYDVIHGWIQRMLIKIADSFELKENQKKKVDFIAPEQWQYIEEPKYLYFELEMPITSSYLTIDIIHSGSILCTINTNDCMQYNFFKKNGFVIDLFKVVKQISTENINYHDLTFNFKLYGVNSTAKVENLCLLSDTRADIIQQAEIFKLFGLQATSFSSHGIGLLFGVGHMPNEKSSDKRCLADCKENPHYSLDIVNDFGVDFINTFSNTSILTLKKINELVFMNNTSDCDVIYDFYRYFSILNEDEIYERLNKRLKPHEINPSLSDFLGYQIKSLLDNLNRNGDGGIIYTHAAVKSNFSSTQKDYGVENFFNEETKHYLKVLSDSFYGKAHNDIFIAPVSIMLRYSQIYQTIKNYLQYDKNENILYIQSWYDPVIKKQLPQKKFQYRELRYLTFYVQNPESLRICVDNEEIRSFIINPKDETQQQSVTIIDVNTYKSIISKNIPLEEQYKLNLINCKLSNINEVKLLDNSANINIQLKDITLKNYQFFEIEIENLVNCENIQVIINTDKGKLVIDKSFFIKDKVYIPFYNLVRNGVIDNQRALTANIISIDININGQRDDSYILKSFKLLMDSDNPSEYCIIGGKIFTKTLDNIFYKVDNKIKKCEIIDNMYFVCNQKFKKGQIIEFFGEQKDKSIVFPTTGKYLEVGKSDLGLVI